MRRFLEVFEERHDLTRVDPGPCKVQYGVITEYQIISRSRAVTFHLVLNYNKKDDGISVTCLQYDTRKFQSDLELLDNDIQSLLVEINGGSPISVEATGPAFQEFLFASETAMSTSRQPTDNYSPVIPTRNSLSNIRLGKQPENNDILLHDLKTVCVAAGARFPGPMEAAAFGLSKGITGLIAGFYHETRFRVSIHGFSDGGLDLDEFFAVWEEPKNARITSLPGIKFLVDVLDATIASKKYLQMVSHNCTRIL